MTMDIKQRLFQVLQRHSDSPYSVGEVEVLCGDALAKIEALEAQFPKGMEHCTFEVIECDLGHSRLTAKNWIDHGCPWCKFMKIREIASNR